MCSRIIEIPCFQLNILYGGFTIQFDIPVDKRVTHPFLDFDSQIRTLAHVLITVRAFLSRPNMISLATPAGIRGSAHLVVSLFN